MLCRSRDTHLAKILPDHGSGMRRIVHTHIVMLLSVVVLIIDQNRVFALETKCETPIAADHDRPVAFKNFSSPLWAKLLITSPVYR
jgi:hypothetical protein